MSFLVLLTLVSIVCADVVKVDVLLEDIPENAPILRVVFQNRTLSTLTTFYSGQPTLVICFQTDEVEENCRAVSTTPHNYSTNALRTRMVRIWKESEDGTRILVAVLSPLNFTPWIYESDVNVRETRQQLFCADQDTPYKPDVYFKFDVYLPSNNSVIFRLVRIDHKLITMTMLDGPVTETIHVCYYTDRGYLCAKVCHVPCLLNANIDINYDVEVLHILPDNSTRVLAIIAFHDFEEWTWNAMPTEVCIHDGVFAKCQMSSSIFKHAFWALSHMVLDALTSPKFWLLFVAFFTPAWYFFCRETPGRVRPTAEVHLTRILKLIERSLATEDDENTMIAYVSRTNAGWLTHWKNIICLVWNCAVTINLSPGDLVTYWSATNIDQTRHESVDYITPENPRCQTIAFLQRLKTHLRWIPKTPRSEMIAEMIAFWESSKTGEYNFQAVLKCPLGPRCVQIALKVDAPGWPWQRKLPPCGFRILQRSVYLEWPQALRTRLDW